MTGYKKEGINEILKEEPKPDVEVVQTKKRKEKLAAEKPSWDIFSSSSDGEPKTATKVKNPYAEMMRTVEQNKADEPAKPKGRWASADRPFGGTLDSIQGRSDNTNKNLQRNAYFDKLSEQMRTLQNKDSGSEESAEEKAEDELEAQAELAQTEEEFIPEEEEYIDEEYLEDMLDEEELLREDEIIADALESLN